jgi:hypothetical protein
MRALSLVSQTLEALRSDMLILFAAILQIVLIFLKLTGMISWKWYQVLIPAWMMLIILTAVVIILVGTFAFTMMVASTV